MEVRSWELGVRSCGFTFVELLVAAIMVSILFVGLSAHLRQGLMAWQRVTQFSDMRQREHVIADQLERDLTGAVVFQLDKDKYGTTPGQLRPLLFQQDRLEWYALRRAGGRERPSIRFVTYACEPVGGVSWFRRTTQTLDEVRKGQPAPAPELLAPGCDEFAVRFAYLPETGGSGALEWQSSWPKDGGDPLALPALVEVRVNLQERDAEGQPRGRRRVVRRICAVPLGTLEAFSTAGP